MLATLGRAAREAQRVPTQVLFAGEIPSSTSVCGLPSQGGSQYGASGGQLDFVRGAYA